MNYIRQLSGFFVRLADDERMTPYHISLYLALFQQWNLERFADQFVISRSEMMHLSRIGSVNTYARCIKELEVWGYIKYSASSNLHHGSRVSCIRFDTTTDTATDTGSSTASNTSIFPRTEFDIEPVTAIKIGSPSSIESDTGTDTGKDTDKTTGIKNDTTNDTTSDTSISSDLNNDTATDTTSDTSISSGIENDTASDIGSDTGNSSGIKNDTATDTAGDTGIPSGIENDTARNTATDTGELTGITAGIKSDTACDTLFINIINKNKPKKEREGNFDFSNENKKTKNKPQKENSQIQEENFHSPNFPEVEIFFRKNNYPITQSEKFYNHYQSVGWKLGGKTKIIDWQAAARKWMINAKNFETNEREPNHIRTGKLSVNTNKDYSEPL